MRPPGGDIAYAWVDQGRKDVFFQRFGRDGEPRLPAPVDVSRSNRTFSWLPRLAFAPGDPDRIYLLWQEIIFSGGSHGGDILFARSRDGGRTFDPPVNLSRSMGGDGKGRIDADTWHNGSLDVAVAPDGTVLAAWTEYHGTLWVVRSSDGGGSFTPAAPVAGSTQLPARGPSLAVAPDGTVLLAWTHGEDRAADIHVARSDDGGATFDEPTVVAPGPAYADAPKLAVDGEGIAHLVYSESPAGPLATARIHHARSRDGFRTLDGASRAISPPGASFPAIALGAGAIHVAWEEAPRPGERPTALALTRSRDGGRRFDPHRVIPGSRAPPDGANGSHQGLLMRKLDAGPDGTIAVAVSHLVEGRESRVRLVRGSAR